NRRLNAVAAISAGDGWAVGGLGPADSSAPLLEHWDGQQWNAIPAGFAAGELHGVAAAGADKVWAVGTYGYLDSARTLVEHWDGQAWAQVPSPNVGAGQNELDGVAIYSPSDI